MVAEAKLGNLMVAEAKGVKLIVAGLSGESLWRRPRGEVDGGKDRAQRGDGVRPSG